MSCRTISFGRVFATGVVGLACASLSCSPGANKPGEQRFTLTGQVISVDESRHELTIAHDAIDKYMMAMVMPFKVRSAAELAPLKPGDFVRGTLVVQPTDGYLEGVQRTGSGELPRAQQPPPATVEFLIEGDHLPDARFIDQQKDVRHLRDDVGKAVVLTFIYTRCPFPTFCPMMDRHFKSIQREVADTPVLKSRVRLLSVTLDPAFDTPDVLSAHATRLQADPQVWSFVRPDDQAANELSTRLGVTSTRESNDNGIIVHSLVTAVIGPDGVVSKIFRGNEWTPRDVTTVLEAVLRSV